MKLSFAILIIYFASFTSVSGQEWIEFRNDSIGFKIDSPMPLAFNKTSAMTDMGNLNVNAFGYVPTDSKENLVYQVIIIEYPEDSFPEDSLTFKADILKSLVNQSTEEPGSELVYKEETYSYGEDIIQWRIHSNNKISIKSRAFIKGDRVIIIQVMTKIDKSLNTDIDKFMDSFRLL